jgi:hypothetical protein
MARGVDSTHLDVDRMIIDFVEYQAVGAVFDDYYNFRNAFEKSQDSPSLSSQEKIEMVDCKSTLALPLATMR